MEGAKQQRLQDKREISKKLETECNQLKQENTKLQHQRQQDTEQYQKLCKKTQDLQEGQVFSQYFVKASHIFPAISSH